MQPTGKRPVQRMNKNTLCFYLIIGAAIAGSILAITNPFDLQIIYAQESDFYRGLDYSKTVNPDGSITQTLGLPPYINDNGEFKPFVYSEDNDHLIVETNHGSVKLHKTACTFEFYNNGYIVMPVYDQKGNIIDYSHKTALFTDSIVPLIADEGTMNYSVLNSVNDSACSVSWNGSELTATKLNPSVGLLEYKYILNNGQWKTQLEATNLSSATNKQFGFTQTIDLNSDVVNYGGSQKNLDNFNGTSFDRTWLENNKSRVIDLLTDFYFDFDLSFDNLNQVNVWDTGINKSKLSFDYVYNQSVILPGEKLIIDPTFGYDLGTVYSVDTDLTTSSTCGTPTSITSSGWVLLDISSSSGECYRTSYEFDTSSIPDNANIINTTIRYDSASVINARNCDWNEMNQKPSTLSASALWSEIGDDTTYVSNDASCSDGGTNNVEDLGTFADDDLENLLTEDYFAVGMKFNDETRDASLHRHTMLEPELQVTFNMPPDPPKRNGGSVVSNEVAMTWFAGETNGDTHQTFEVERWSGSSWVELVSQSAVDHTDTSPIYTNSTAKYIIWDTGLLGRLCPQFVMNSTIVADLHSHFPLCYTTNDNGIEDNDGTVTGSEIFTNSTGTIFFEFDGTNDYISLPNETDYDREHTNKFSIVTSFKTTETDNDSTLFSKGSQADPSCQEGYYLEVQSNKLQFIICDDMNNQFKVTSTTSVNDGNEHHAVATFSGNSNQSGMKIYIDGTLEATGTSSTISNMILNNEVVVLGAESDAGSKFTGSQRNVMYFDIELDAHQIDQLYNEYIDTPLTIPIIPPDAPTLSGSVLSTSSARFTSVAGASYGDYPVKDYGLRCEENGAGGWLNTVANSTLPIDRTYDYTGLSLDDIVVCQWRDGSLSGWSNWSNNATVSIVFTDVIGGTTPLNDLEDWFQEHSGLYFGMGIFSLAFVLIAAMATPKTVPIFTIILMIFAGILHITEILQLPAWFWGIAIILVLPLIFKRKN